MTLETNVNDYKAKTSRSRQMYEEALRVMPGGNSRTTTFFDPYPFYITRGQGARIWDADGAERLDFNGNYTSLILGHAHPSVVEAITEQATRGMSFPGPSEHEVKLAGVLTTRIPSMEVVRFTNSGTEATMNAVRVAQGGAQARFGVRPDLTTLGKIIGGGLAVGAFGGRAEVMNYYDPRGGKGRISHGGTFNANAVTMAGGLATMQELTPEAYAKLEALGERLRAGVKRVLSKAKRSEEHTSELQ